MIAPTSRKVGKYEIRQKLGRGGMADVYMAVDTTSGHSVALKLIEYADDADTRDSIEAERRGAELQARLAALDEHVVRVYDAGDADGYFYVAMEYIDGQDLHELMRGRPLEPSFAVDVALAVARTLESAHGLQVSIGGKDFHGVVHGDIKPKNVRIDARGEVRVLDFGIAKALSLSRRLTRNEFGSVPYASPERLDTGDVNFGSDLWSLAVMLYEMVTGMQPYKADTTERLERMIRSRIPPPPAPDPCPEPLRRILIKSMAPDPHARYQSAAGLAGDLEAFRAGGPVAAMDAGEEDPDATRRTAPRAEEVSVETRRTAHPQAPSARDTDETRRRPLRKPRSAFGTAMRVIVALVAISLGYCIWLGASDYLLYQHGQELARDIETEQLTDPDQIWTKWSELSRGHESSLFLHGPRKVVKQRFVAAADHVIDTYRTTDAPVTEKDWERARLMAAHALAVDPDDGVRGKVRIAEGHLARINGTVHRKPEDLNLAVEKFTEARRLLPRSPDPELGLARVYVYGLKDIDKAYDALQEAQKLGYQLGNREKLQLADGYRDRADRLWWDSRSVRGLPPEKDQIQRAADDYQRALELYQGIAPFGKALANIVRVRLSLASVNYRLHEIETPQ
ncbi:MAG TPA: serine/threonine-protein kinase [Verrucomicrobiae bacterium]|nr:serine/threonine-protein kinase [Verrucomicrobiae bacterium]